MLSSNLDASELFAQRQTQRSSMHARHLNEQLVRVLTVNVDKHFADFAQLRKRCDRAVDERARAAVRVDHAAQQYRAVL